jgi:cytochrome P450
MEKGRCFVSRSAETGASHRPIPTLKGLDAWRFAYGFWQCPNRRLLQLMEEHGDIVRVIYPLETFVFLGRSEYVEHVLHHRHQNYDKRTSAWGNVRQVWGEGLLVADGDHWRRQRQRMQPAFHQEALERFAAIVVEEAGRISETWEAAAARGESRDVYPDMLGCAVRAIARAVFGANVERTEAIRRALAEIHEYINPMSLVNLARIPPRVQHLVNPEYRRFRRGAREIHRLLGEIIEARLSAQPDRRDLLGMMMSACDEETSQPMTRGQLYDEMIGMLMAGHETTAISATWTWYWLSRYPDAERELHRELDSVLAGRVPSYEDLPRLPFTRMVFQESLRLTPPTWALDRRALADDEIDGHVIPAGAFVGFSPYVMHHLRRYWTDPEVFDPYRFSAERSAGRPAYAYCPFGGGPRRCIGMRFAMAEGCLILAVLAQSYSVRRLTDTPVEPLARTTLSPNGGMPMTIARRAMPVQA